MTKSNRELLNNLKQGKRYSEENPKVIRETLTTLFGEAVPSATSCSSYWNVPGMTSDEVGTTVKCALSAKNIAMDIFNLHGMITDFEGSTIIRLGND